MYATNHNEILPDTLSWRVQNFVAIGTVYIISHSPAILIKFRIPSKYRLWDGSLVHTQHLIGPLGDDHKSTPGRYTES